MQTKKRRFEPGVIERLFAQPQRFDYFQAVRMLELWLRRNGVPHESAANNFLRFQNSVSLSFPASQIEALHLEPPELRTDAASLAEALRRNQLKYVRITPAFMGFLGMTGTLPAHYTERIASHAMYNKDDAARAFLDTFSTRVLAQFYEAWRKYRLELKYQLVGKDQFLPLLLALGGVGHNSLQNRLAEGGDGLLDASLGYFCGALLHRPTSAESLARVTAEYFGQQVEVEQFVGNWYELPLAQQSTLGGKNAVLGATAVVGARAWQRDLRLRLTVGPLNRAGFESFLPGGTAARALVKLLTMFTGLTLEYEVELVLRCADVRGIVLDSNRSGGRLGWDTFLDPSRETGDRHDVRYQIHAM